MEVPFNKAILANKKGTQKSKGENGEWDRCNSMNRKRVETLVFNVVFAIVIECRIEIFFYPLHSSLELKYVHRQKLNVNNFSFIRYFSN